MADRALFEGCRVSNRGLSAPLRDVRAPLRWYACRTRARAEKQVQRRLLARGFEAYLPLIEQTRQWADRQKRVAFPLFPGYVFARFDLGRAREVVTTPAVVGLVSVAGGPNPLRDEEIASLQILEAGMGQTGNVPEQAPYVEVGQEVVVQSGPFSGMRGVLTDERGRARIVVRLPALKRAVSVELPRELVLAVA